MRERSHKVGYGRPPEHTRFQKGQSGNPGGKPGPKKRRKQKFDAAMGDALDGNRWELKEAKPGNVIDALARKITLDALDGRTSAQKLLLSILDGEECETTEAAPGSDEYLRQILGERYDATKARFDAALASGNRGEIEAIRKEIEDLEQFPASGNFSGNFEKNGHHTEARSHGKKE
jgi:hypothetical protein